MQRLEVSGAVRPLYGSLGVKGLIPFNFDVPYFKVPWVYSLYCYECVLWQEMWWKMTLDWLLVHGFLLLVEVSAVNTQVCVELFFARHKEGGCCSLITLYFQQLVTSKRVEIPAPIFTHVLKTIPPCSCHSLIVHETRYPRFFPTRLWPPMCGCGSACRLVLNVS